MTNQEILKKIKIDHNLTNREIAEKLGVSIKTVEGWMSSTQSKMYRNISNQMLELLKLKL